jgi:hypothetical protein
MPRDRLSWVACFELGTHSLYMDVSAHAWVWVRACVYVCVCVSRARTGMHNFVMVS